MKPLKLKLKPKLNSKLAAMSFLLSLTAMAQDPFSDPAKTVGSTSEAGLSGSSTSTSTSTSTSGLGLGLGLGLGAGVGLAPNPGTSTGLITGVVREKGTRKPLSSVNLFCILTPENPPLKTVSDIDGNFSLQNPTSQPCKWVINLAGFERFDAIDTDFLQDYPRDFYLERSNYQIYETTVYTQKEKRDANTKSLTANQVIHIAGGGNDPVKAVQNFPGVARGSFLSSNIAIEGSAPQDTQYFVDNMDVPIILHFSGIYSILNPGAIERIDFLPAGFGPEYGRSSAGYVGAWTKTPAQDRLHGTGYLDIFNAGAMLEGPTGKDSSFLISARTTYFGPILGLIAKNNPNFNLTAVPDFTDTTGIYQTQLTPQDHFKLVTVGSKDTFGFILNQPASGDPLIRGNFSLVTAFFRLIPQLTHKYSDSTTGRLSFGLGKDWIYQNVADIHSNTNNVTLTSRAEIETQVLPFWKTYVGTDTKSTWTNIEVSVPYRVSQGGVSAPVSGAATNQASINSTINNLGFYWRNTLHDADSPWTFSPGVRTDYFSQTRELIPTPRLAVKYALTPSLNLKSSGGLYSQAPNIQQMDSKIGNPNLIASRTWHATLGIEKDFRNQSAHGWTLDSNLFYKYFTRAITASNTFIAAADGTLSLENYNNGGSGRAFGLELQAKFDLERGLSGWFSYTLSRSTRTYPPQAEALFQFDQTHIFTVVANQDLGHNYLISARLRYVTGNPYTPVTGSTLDSDNDVYVPIAGSYYSARYKPFFQLDLRAEKKWIYQKWILTAYLDVMNATNAKNQESLIYSYDYSQSTALNGIPFLPTFGFKGEF